MALVVFLRGINVGEHRRFRPAALAAALKHLDTVNVGAAGTFVIRGKVTRTRLRAELARRLPFAAEIAMCDSREILDLISRDPFAAERVPSGAVRFVSVLSNRPRLSASLPVIFPLRGTPLLAAHTAGLKAPRSHEVTEPQRRRASPLSLWLCDSVAL